jgi:hypothetical protein
VQGRLRNEFVAVEVETKCKHCEQVLHITVNSQMQVSVREQGAAPLVFSPEVDWSHFAQKTIIDTF